MALLILLSSGCVTDKIQWSVEGGIGVFDGDPAALEWIHTDYGNSGEQVVEAGPK
jgi:hypothetical protein